MTYVVKTGQDIVDHVEGMIKKAQEEDTPMASTRRYAQDGRIHGLLAVKDFLEELFIGEVKLTDLKEVTFKKPEHQPAEPAVLKEPIVQFFEWGHLPEHLQAVSKPFCKLAVQIIDNLPRNPQRTVALRKLLEAKDAAVRARLMLTGAELEDRMAKQAQQDLGAIPTDSSGSDT